MWINKDSLLPNFEIKIWTSESMLEFLQKFYDGEVVHTYEALEIFEQPEFFKYCVLHVSNYFMPYIFR